MKDFTTLQVEKEGAIAQVILNRPEIHNAFNEVMIEELINAFQDLESDKEVRIIVLKAKGKSFCAGADLNWMRDVVNYSFEQNYEESMQLAKCFHTIYACSKTTIAIVQGAAIGGANGLLASCDFVIADNETIFSLSEVKIGIIPSCIAPYVLKRVGEFKAKELMLTGQRFKGKKAKNYGLVNWAVPKIQIEQKLNALIEQLLSSGPVAISRCKELVYQLSNEMKFQDSIEYTARMIAQIRASEEGQEGMAAFLEKRKPNWVSE